MAYDCIIIHETKWARSGAYQEVRFWLSVVGMATSGLCDLLANFDLQLPKSDV